MFCFFFVFLLTSVYVIKSTSLAYGVVVTVAQGEMYRTETMKKVSEVLKNIYNQVV